MTGKALSAWELYKEAGECGFDNPLGHNNCFLNSVLQIMYHMKDFRLALIEAAKGVLNESVRDLSVEDVDGVDALSPARRALLRIYHLFTEYDRRDERVLNPLELRQAMAALFPMFKAGSLQDAHECMGAVLDMVHNALSEGTDTAAPPSPPPAGVAYDFFGIRLELRARCGTPGCGKTERYYENDSFYRTIWAHTLLQKAVIDRSGDDDGDEKGGRVFERMLRGDDAPITCDHCKQKVAMVTSLRAPPPKVFAVNVAWHASSVDRDVLRQFLAAVPVSWRLRDSLPVAGTTTATTTTTTTTTTPSPPQVAPGARNGEPGQLAAGGSYGDDDNGDDNDALSTPPTPLVPGAATLRPRPPWAAIDAAGSDGGDGDADSSLSSLEVPPAGDGGGHGGGRLPLTPPKRNGGGGADDCTAVLEGVVFYYGMHYVSSFYNRDLRAWVVFDDSHVRGIPGSVLRLWEYAVNGKLMPFMLFYRTGPPGSAGIADVLANFDAARRNGEPLVTHTSYPNPHSGPQDRIDRVLAWLLANTRQDFAAGGGGPDGSASDTAIDVDGGPADVFAFDAGGGGEVELGADTNTTTTSPQGRRGGGLDKKNKKDTRVKEKVDRTAGAQKRRRGGGAAAAPTAATDRDFINEALRRVGMASSDDDGDSATAATTASRPEPAAASLDGDADAGGNEETKGGAWRQSKRRRLLQPTEDRPVAAVAPLRLRRRHHFVVDSDDSGDGGRGRGGGAGGGGSAGIAPSMPEAAINALFTDDSVAAGDALRYLPPWDAASVRDAVRAAAALHTRYYVEDAVASEDEMHGLADALLARARAV